MLLLQVMVPKFNCLVLVTVAGIRTPRGDGENAQFDAQALKLVKQAAMQRDVLLDVVGVQDRAGAIFAAVEVNKRDLGSMLLERGLGESFGRSDMEHEYQALQKKAQLAKKGMWQHYDPEAEAKQARAAESAATAAANAPAEMWDVMVTEIVDGNRLYLQKLGEVRLGAAFCCRVGSPAPRAR